SDLFESSPNPRYRMSRGTQASDGTARAAPMVGERNESAKRDKPTSEPSASPMIEPMTKPRNTRWVEMPMYCQSRSRAARSNAAVTTDSGVGSLNTGTHARWVASHQRVKSASGRMTPSSQRQREPPRRRSTTAVPESLEESETASPVTRGSAGGPATPPRTTDSPVR